MYTDTSHTETFVPYLFLLSLLPPVLLCISVQAALSAALEGDEEEVTFATADSLPQAGPYLTYNAEEGGGGGGVLGAATTTQVRTETKHSH